MPKLDGLESQTLSCALRVELQQSEKARFLHRLHCVILVGQGYSCRNVAKCFDADSSTVARWTRHFKGVGTDGLRDDLKSGRPAKLGLNQLKALEQDLRKTPAELGYNGTRWYGKVLATHLQQRHGVNLSVRQCQRLLRQVQQPLASSPGTPPAKTAR
jgi:putative transposase